MKYIRYIVLFALGGGSYVGMELLYRGYSHVSMFLAGGLCFLLIGRGEGQPMSRTRRLLRGAGIITAVELVTGLLVNRDYGIWDYRAQPGNFLGQICPLFMLLWLPVAAAAGKLYTWANRLLTPSSNTPPIPDATANDYPV